MIDFLTFTLWALGGALVISVALIILGTAVIRIRHDWLIDVTRLERNGRD